MKRYLLCIIAAAIASAVSVNCPAAAKWIEQLERSSLPVINPQDVKVAVLKNGIRCYLLEDHTVPVVKVRVITRAGGIYDEQEKKGLSTLAGALMRSGGAGKLSPLEFDAEVDSIGGVLESDIGQEMAAATLQVLSTDMEKGLALLFDMVFAPRFDEARLKVAKINLEEALRREDDDPESLAARKFRQLIYGEESPWARRPDDRTIAGISRDDIKQLHDHYFKTNNMIIAAAGDFNTASILNLIREKTADAPSGKVDFPEVQPVDLKFEQRVEHIEKPTTQAFIRMGHLSIKRLNSDKYALFLLDEILGAGSFKSRLMDDIRTKRGMAYSVWSSIAPGTDYGLFTVGVNTKASQAETTIELVKEHIERLTKQGDITDGELSYAKRSVLSRLIFEFDRAFKVVDGRARFYFYGYPDNYWSIYRDRIAGEQIPDLKRVGEKYLHPDEMGIIEVGPKDAKEGRKK